MNLPIFALFNRSLRRDAQHAMTYAVRLALALVILWALVVAHASAGSTGAPGLGFFEAVMTINVAFITLAGFSYFSSVITEEKEEMTLGLLRMTALNPVAILLGKSTSRLLTAVMMLAVQVPFTVLSVTLGGVSMRQVLASYATLAAYTLLLSNLALLFSVTSRRTAWAATKLGLMVVAGLIMYQSGAITVLAGGRVRGTWEEYGVQVWNAVHGSLPMVRLDKILSTGYAGPVVGLDVWLMLGGGLVSFLVAWAMFNLATREQHDESPGRAFVVRGDRWWRGLGAGRAWRRPLIWKDYNFIVGGRVMWWTRMIGLFIVISFMSMAVLSDGGGVGKVGLTGLAVTAGLLYLELLIQASRIFRTETQWKTLSGLMVLPMPPGVVVREKIYGCLLGMTPYAVMMVLMLSLAGLELTGWIADGLDWRDEFGGVVSIGFFGLVALLGTAQCVFFLYLVAYLSLVMKRGALAMALAIWFLSGCLLHCAMVVTPFLIPVIHYQVKARLMRLATEEV